MMDGDKDKDALSLCSLCHLACDASYLISGDEGATREAKPCNHPEAFCYKVVEVDDLNAAFKVRRREIRALRGKRGHSISLWLRQNMPC